MIHFQLVCQPAGHGFDGWFRSSGDFDRQAGCGLVACPVCGTTAISKALMAPAVKQEPAPAQAGPVNMVMGDARAVEMRQRLQALTRQARAGSEYVGPRFAEEARRIHFGETGERSIYGEASGDEVRSLLEDGIPALPLPALPEDGN